MPMPVTSPPEYKGHLSESPVMLAGVKALPAGEEVLALQVALDVPERLDVVEVRHLLR